MKKAWLGMDKSGVVICSFIVGKHETTQWEVYKTMDWDYILLNILVFTFLHSFWEAVSMHFPRSFKCAWQYSWLSLLTNCITIPLSDSISDFRFAFSMLVLSSCKAFAIWFFTDLHFDCISFLSSASCWGVEARLLMQRLHVLVNGAKVSGLKYLK